MSCLLLLRTIVYLDEQHLHISASVPGALRQPLHISYSSGPPCTLPSTLHPKDSAPVPALSPFFFIHIRSKPLLYFNNTISSIFLSISKMLFTTVTAFLFSVAVMAAPARKPATKEGECTPVTLTLTEFVIAESASYNYVSFNANSQYIANSPADDVLRSGVNCEADGVTIPKGDIQCNIGGHRVDDLTFQLLYTSGGRAYKLDHTWQCDGYVPQPSLIVQVD